MPYPWHMQKAPIIKPEPTTGQRLVGKREMARTFGFCPRTADNFLAKGLPHIALSKRKTLFDLDEVEAWLHRTFGTQRIGPANAKGKPAVAADTGEAVAK